MKNSKKFISLLLLFLIWKFSSAQTTIYSEAFTGSFPSTWTRYDSTGGGNWIYSNSAKLRRGTASTGVLKFDSESYGNDGFPELSKLISPKINCSAASKVFLSFNQLFVQYTNSRGRVYVSNDSINWINVFEIKVNSRNPDSVIVDVSSIAASQSQVYLMFEYTGDWDLFWEIDDVKLFIPKQTDLGVSDVIMDDYVLPGNHYVDYELSNYGASFIDSVIVECKLDGFSLYDTLSNVFLPPNYSIRRRFPVPVWIPDARRHDIVITSNVIEPLIDVFISNNSASKIVSGLSSKVNKNVLLEVFSSVNDGYCPTVPGAIDSITSSLPFVKTVVHHFSDFYEIMESNTLRSAFSLNAAPSALINRSKKDNDDEADRPLKDWFPYCITENSKLSPLSYTMKVSYDNTTRIATITMNGMFHGVVSNEPRLLLQITQDNIYNNQRNSFHLNPSFVTSSFYSLPPILDSFYQPKVVISSPSGIYGNNASISYPTVDSQTFFYVFTYLVPSSIDPSQLSFSTSVCTYNTNVYDRNILNTLSCGINDSAKVLATPVVYSGINFQTVEQVDCILFPNPASDVVRMDCGEYLPFRISLFNSQGQFLSGSTDLFFDISQLPEGVYYLRIEFTNGQSIVKKLFKE